LFYLLNGPHFLKLEEWLFVGGLGKNSKYRLLISGWKEWLLLTYVLRYGLMESCSIVDGTAIKPRVEWVAGKTQRPDRWTWTA